MPRLSIASVVALIAIASHPASAEELPTQCGWQFKHHATVDRPVVCMCGPPVAGIITLEPLLDELGVEKPEFEGNVMQQVGGIFGTYSYAPGSSVCMSAQHAGLLEDSANIGGIVTFMASEGCERYEGTTQNGMRSQESGPQNWSFYFPKLTNGACPGEAGYGNRYAGGPALDVLLGMLSVALPKEAVRYASAESQGIEAFTVERLFLRPPGKPAIAIGRLTVERIDMENTVRKIPPRYFTASVEDVSLPSSYLGPMVEAAFEGKRLSFDASLDFRFHLSRGTLELVGAHLLLEDAAEVRLRARLRGLTSAAIYGNEQAAIELEWVRLRLDDRSLLARLLPRWWNRGEAMPPDGLRAALEPALREMARDADPRSHALLAVFAGLLRDLESPAGELQLYLQPPAPLPFGEIGRLLAEEPGEAAEALRAALLYPGTPGDLGAQPAAGLQSVKPVFAPGENLQFEYRGAEGAGSRIVIHYVGEAPDSISGAWHDLRELPDGRATVGWISPGLYEAVLWVGGEYQYQQRIGAFAWFAIE